MVNSPPIHNLDVPQTGPNKVIFTDKVTKARSEMEKTNDRLQKLET